MTSFGKKIFVVGIIVVGFLLVMIFSRVAGLENSAEFSNLENLPVISKDKLSLPLPLSVKGGVYAGGSLSEAEEFDLLTDSDLEMLAVFVGWGDRGGFPDDFGKFAKGKGKTLVIFWEYGDDSALSPNLKFNYESLANGEWDDYLKKFAETAKVYGAPIILAPFAEMNGDWDLWSGVKNGNSPEKFVRAWRYLHRFFDEAQNVKFVWTVNSESVPDTPENSIGSYYPGSEFTDFVGVDGFNDGNPWRTFAEIFTPALSELKKYEKPIYIMSFASAEGPLKADWIKNAIEIEIPKNKISGWVWFNEDKEKNWRIDSDAESLKAFKKSVYLKND